MGYGCSRTAGVIPHPSSLIPVDSAPAEATRQPVRNEIGSDLPVVFLAMLAAAFMRGQHLERLVLRADGVVELLREFERHDVVVLAVDAIKGAADLLGHAREAVILELLHAGIHVRHAEH